MMGRDIDTSAMREAVESLHSCHANLVDSIHVKEEFQGKTIWDGVIHVFDIEKHPIASTCYAWSSPIEGSDKRKFYAVLRIPPVDSPQKAVRASIVNDFKQTK